MTETITVLDYLDEIDALDGFARDAALLDLQRSDAWRPALLFLRDGRGKVARESFRAGRGTPEAQTWCAAKPNAPAIMRALRIDRDQSGSSYACDAFRVVADDGHNWIAGAVGAPPSLARSTWLPADISDVILWNPRTNETRVLGDRDPTVIAPYDDVITVYADGYAFFRAWADARAEVWGRAVARRDNKWVHPVTEIATVPAAIVIGDIAKVRRWPNATTLIAGPGIDADALRRSVWDSYNVPRVVGATSLSKVA